MDIDRKEVFRYLGLKQNYIPEKNILCEIEGCILELLNISTMKSIYKIFDIKVSENIIDFGAFCAESRSLSKNLADCKKAVLFAATLGTESEIILNRLNRLNVSRAFIMDACAVALIEQYCDDCQREIEKISAEKGLFVRPRFSPGYGDFNIKHQKDFIRLLELPKKLGLTLSEGFMLIPSKSVTAVMGLSTSNKNCNKKGCEMCNNSECLFRRS